MNFFLYAPADIIMSRKREMNEADINSLTEEYRQLFEEFSGKHTKQHYIAINNVNLNNTLDIVMKQCISATF